MGRPRKQQNTVLEGQETIPGVEADTPAASGAIYTGASDGGLSAQPIAAKIAIPLKENGSIDLDSLRASTREKLNKALASTPGLSPAATGTPLSERDCQYLYSLLGGAEIFLATKFMGIPEELASMLAYGDEDVKDLVDPTREVAAKYGMAVMSPEMKLFMVLSAIHFRKILAIKMGMAAIAAREAKEQARTQVN